MTMKVRWLLGSLLVIALLASHFSVYKWAGAKQSSQCQQGYINQLSATTETLKKIAADAGKANLELGLLINQRQKVDEQTSQELRDALSKTQNQRVTCVLDADVLRILTTARDRANQAAASGIVNSVPADSGAGE